MLRCFQFSESRRASISSIPCKACASIHAHKISNQKRLARSPIPKHGFSLCYSQSRAANVHMTLQPTKAQFCISTRKEAINEWHRIQSPNYKLRISSPPYSRSILMARDTAARTHAVTGRVILSGKKIVDSGRDKILEEAEQV